MIAEPLFRSKEQGVVLLHNDLSIGDGGVFEKQKPNICINAQ
jgi:hypothetical protein